MESAKRLKYLILVEKSINTDYEGLIKKFEIMYVSRDLSGHSEKTQAVLDEYTYQVVCDECQGLRYNKQKRDCLIDGLSVATVGELELGGT